MLSPGSVSDLLDDHSLVSAMAQQLHNFPLVGLAKGEVEGLRLRIQNYAKTLRAFGLRIAARHADRVFDSLNGGTFVITSQNYIIEGKPFAQLKRSLDYLQNSLAMEAQDSKILILSAQSAAFMEDEFSLLGKAVDVKFPSLVPEGQEAAKSFALGRWTAAAFHSIRCLETGIRAVCRCLDIPDPTKGSDRNWSNVHRSIKTRMEDRWPTGSDKMSPEFRFFDRIHAALSAFQNPYRNETMHLESNYNEDQARHIIEMVRGFLNEVAVRCDEDGMPRV